MSRIINRVRGIRGSFRPSQVITTPTRGTRGPAQLSDINTLASQLGAAGVGSGAAGNGVPSGGSDGQVLAKVAGAVAWTFTTAITAVGTIVTGVWQGTKIALAYGGTNADLSATGGASKFLKQASAGAAITVVQPAFSDLSGQATLAQLPSIADDTILSNVSGGSAVPAANTFNAVFDHHFGTTDGTYSIKRLTGTWSVVAGSGSGTVTSVAMTVPAELSVSGSPITGAGTLAVTWANQADNKILANISGGSAAPSFSTVTAVLDHALGSTNDKLAVRRSGAWTQDTIASLLTAGAGITISGTTNVTISSTGSTTVNVQPVYPAPIMANARAPMWGDVGDFSFDGAAGTGPDGSGPCGGLTIQWNLPRQQGGFMMFDGIRWAQSNAISRNSQLAGGYMGQGNPLLYLVAENGGQTLLEMDNYSTSLSPTISMLRARGTLSAPTAVQSGDTLFQLGAYGMGATTFTGTVNARFRCRTIENWTDSARGNKWSFDATPAGSSALTNDVLIVQAAGIQIGVSGVAPTGGAMGSGTLNAGTYPSYYTNGNWEGGPVNQAPPANGNVTIAANHSLVAVFKYTPPANAKLILGDGAILKVL